MQVGVRSGTPPGCANPKHAFRWSFPPCPERPPATLWQPCGLASASEFGRKSRALSPPAATARQRGESEGESVPRTRLALCAPEPTRRGAFSLSPLVPREAREKTLAFDRFMERGSPPLPGRGVLGGRYFDMSILQEFSGLRGLPAQRRVCSASAARRGAGVRRSCSEPGHPSQSWPERVCEPEQAVAERPPGVRAGR